MQFVPAAPTFAWPTLVTNVLNQQARTQYDYTRGLAAGVKDANGTGARSEFDVYDRPVRLIAGYGLTGAENTITEMSYPTVSANESKSSKQLDDTRWLTSRTQYDGFGRQVLASQAEDGLHYSNPMISYTIHAKTIYDGPGRAVKTSNPYRSTGSATTDGWTRMAYDLAGRVIEVAAFAGDANTPPPDYPQTNANWTGSVVTSYSSEVTTVRDQANKQRRSTVDALGRLVTVEEMNEYPATSVYAATNYAYDARGNLLTATQAQGATTQTRRFAYDLLSRLLFAANPEQDTSSNALFTYNNQQWAVRYLYNVASNLTDKTDTRPVGSSFVNIHYDYDALNRVTQRSYNDNTPTATYSYDTASNGVGRLRSVTASGVSTYNYTAYDKLGRPTAYNQVTEGQTYLMENTYNKAGLVTSEKYPSQKVMLMEYDAAGRSAGVKKQGASFYYVGDAATNATNRLQYTAHGGVSVMKLGNNLWEHTNFNSRLQPLQVGLGSTAINSSVLGLDYTYSPVGGGDSSNNGNVLTQTINAAGTVMKQTYGYDVVNRLASAQEIINTKLKWVQSYSYDRWGNRTGLVNTGPEAGLLPTPSTPAVNAATNRLAAYSYDAAGNQTQMPTGEYMQYNGESRQVRYGSGVVRYGYSYDGDGRRVRKVNEDGGDATVFVYDMGGRLVAEYVASTGSLPNVKVSYLTADHLGSPRVVTESNGAVRVRRDYLPFGEEIPSTVAGRTPTLGYGGNDATRQKFTSKERDTESGLDYFLARYYASAQGRFTSVDPLIASARSIEPQSWNRYSYTINNPLKYTDSTGLDWWYDTKGTGNAVPTWFDKDPHGSWKRWADTYDYVYQPVNAGGLWSALNPNGPNAFLTDTQEKANAQFDKWAGTGLIGGTLAQRDWLAGFAEGASPLGLVTGWVNGVAGADTTSRDYQGGMNTGMLAAAMASGAGGVIRSLTASSASVAVAEKALKKGASMVEVGSAEEAAEVFMHTYQGGQGPGIRNTTGMTGNQVRNDKFLFPNGKAGTYHWDLADTQHGGVPHLQVHKADGTIVRIFFKVGN